MHATNPKTPEKTANLNGIDVEALQAVVRDIKADSARGMVEFHVTSAWQGQTRSRTTVESYRMPPVCGVRME